MRVIPPRVVRPSVPHGLDQICMKALAHNPRDRYSRMQQMIDALMEERFANQWRDGASDLAQAIREVVPTVSPLGNAGPRTMVTDRPVTIVTRSLIEQTPHRRSAPRVVDPTPAPSIHQASISQSQSTASRDEVESMPQPPVLVPQMFELPPALRIDGPAMPQFRLPESHLPAADLASARAGARDRARTFARAAGAQREAARGRRCEEGPERRPPRQRVPVGVLLDRRRSAPRSEHRQDLGRARPPLREDVERRWRAPHGVRHRRGEQDKVDQGEL
jgi:hypothetical protein